MKVVITDLNSDKELEHTHYAPLTEEIEEVLNTREAIIDNIIGNIYRFAFPHIFVCPSYNKLLESSEETFILSPHADMVREETIDEDAILDVDVHPNCEEDTSFVTYHNVSLREIARCMVEDTEEPEETHEE